jgi:hypothetical protein
LLRFGDSDYMFFIIFLINIVTIVKIMQPRMDAPQSVDKTPGRGQCLCAFRLGLVAPPARGSMAPPALGSIVSPALRF